MDKTTYKAGKLSFVKECLFEGLLRILKDKPLEDISISELSQVSGISRSTFYRNYHSVIDVVEDYLTIFPFGSKEEDFTSDDKYDFYRRIYDSLAFIKKNRILFERLFEAHREMLLFDNFDMLVKSLCRNRAHDIGYYSEYDLTRFSGTYFALCFRWIEGGMKESVQEMAGICYDILMRT
ncbi:MAG: TetR family transcriptional regulator C-terminal domain-containing protein [Clostridiales bacterium]|nr:TetR family transcriptional regulator C-terminal domain-containing protein [Clostridiales bacterium]